MTGSRRTTHTLTAALSRVNGRRRERILSLAEVAQAVREALADGVGYTSGGRVPNSYGYPAFSTQAVAVAFGDLVSVGVRVGPANASPLTWTSAPGRGCHALAAWHRRLTWTTATHWADIVITRRVAFAWLRSLQPAVVAPVPVPLVDVTLADSTRAGNCRPTSLVVAAWFAPRTAVPAAELLDVIAARAPHLRSFALRAIAAAGDRA